MSTEGDWQRWRARFDQNHNGIIRLFHDRAIWRTILAMLDANPAISRGGHGEYWLGSCYTTSQLISIRRETGADSHSVGLRRSLHGLASHPRMATRKWYEQQIRQMGYKGWEFTNLAAMFDRFARPSEPFIDPARVSEDLGTLDAVIATVNTFTTKTLAHRDDTLMPSKPSALPITWRDLDAAIDTVGTIHKKYYTLCHPGESLGSLTPIKSRGWIQMFETAWMPPGFTAPDDLDFNPHAETDMKRMPDC